MKYILPVLIILIILLGAFFFYYSQNREIENPEEVLNKEQITALLENNETGAEFMQNYGDFEVEKINPLTKEEIEERRIEGDYREMFEPLLLEDDRYVEMEVVSKERDLGLVSIVDLKEDEIVEIYYLFLVTI